jgi:Flp pilus assembly pilin Flp
MRNIVKSFIVQEDGAEIAEYALLIVILALGLLSAAPGVAKALFDAFSNTSSRVSTGASDLGASGVPTAPTGS